MSQNQPTTTADPSAKPAGSAELTPEDRGTAFRPVEGGGDTTSGELLLIEAYAAIWLLAFALIFLSIRRQKRLDERIERLTDDLARAKKKA